MIKPAKIEVKNKRAEFDYQILERYQAGIILTGSEIKSIRNGGGSISEAFCILRDGELFVKNMNIPEYSHGAYANHEPLRVRKLLLNKKELNKIDAKVREKGLTLIPLRLTTNDRGIVKIEIGLAKGKKMYDKRDSIKQKENKRELERVMKRYR